MKGRFRHIFFHAVVFSEQPGEHDEKNTEPIYQGPDFAEFLRALTETIFRPEYRGKFIRIKSSELPGGAIQFVNLDGLLPINPIR